METWRLLAGLAVMLVIYAALTRAFGYEASAAEVLVAALLGGLGLYLGNVLAERLFSDRE